MKLDKVLCCMFSFSFVVLTLHKTQSRNSCLLRTAKELTNVNVGYVIHAQCMSAKQKILQGRGPSNLNLGLFVCSFDVCRVS